MATIKPRFTFIDVDRGISQYSNTPCLKVLLTLNEPRIFNVTFKNENLVWLGRKPVKEGVV